MSNFVYKQGTITVTNGGVAVIGTLTNFPPSVKQGDLLIVGQNFGVIASDPTTETGLTLMSAWQGQTITTADYCVVLFSPRHEWPTDVWARIRLATEHATTILSGSGAPALDYGVVGDVYFDTANQVFYGAKTSSGWPVGIQLKGLGLPVPGGSGDTLKLPRVNAAGTAYELFAPPSSREVLTAARNYFVATTGSDTNSGLTAGSPLRTIQKAVATVAALDISTFNVTVNVAEGSYPEQVSLSDPVGSGSCYLLGVATDPSLVTVGSGSRALIADGATNKWFHGHLTVAAAVGVTVNGSIARLRQFGHVRFGACSSAHVYVTNHGHYEAFNVPRTLAGNAPYHVLSDRGGKGLLAYNPMTFSAGLTVSSFAYLYQSSNWSIYGNSTVSGTVTGKRHDLLSGSNLHTGGALLPGSLAGYTEAGSFYD